MKNKRNWAQFKKKMFTEQQLCAWCFIWNYKNIALALMAGGHVNLFLKDHGYFISTEDLQ